MHSDGSEPAPAGALELARELMQDDSLRGARLLIELERAEHRLQAHRIRSTIVVFGSARLPSPESSWQASSGHGARWYAEARRFGQLVSERGGALRARGGWRHNVIATGGGPGAMEAANRGAFEAGAPSIGFNIGLPRQQQTNRYTTPALTMRFRYFAVRKLHLALRANALVVFPGGFGTLDELFEILTLVQTGKTRRVPVVMVDRAYWTRIINFPALLEEQMIDAADLELFSFAETAEEAWRCIEPRLPAVAGGS